MPLLTAPGIFRLGRSYYNFVSGVICTVSVHTAVFVTGRIARSVSHRYLFYPEADFEVFRLAWATHCTDGGEIWH